MCSSQLKQISVAALGVGNVGANFLSQLSILSKQLSQLSRSPVTVSLVFVGNSKRALYSTDYSPIPFTSTSSSWLSQLQDESSSSSQPALSMTDLAVHLSNAPGKSILVDNSASQIVADAYPEFLKNGVSVVASNKKAFSGKYSLFEAIYQTAANSLIQSEQTATASSFETDAGYIFHESSCGAGLPIISTLKDLLETGDKVTRIKGIFSGTMSYLFNQFMPTESGPNSAPALSFSAAVTKAKEEGFTEPDARDDLNGLDVARKVVILARLCGWKLETSDFPIESLVPGSLTSCSSGDEFLARLPDFDSQMDELKATARKEGKVIRYVASLDLVNRKASVGMDRFDPSDPIAGIKGSDNIVSFFTERYGDKPLIVQGAGAGGAVTGMGVTSDLLKVIRST